MAKRTGKNGDKVLPAKVEAFAEDLGRLLGTAQVKADHWLGQRQDIVKHLTAVRDTASKLLADLGHQAERAGARVEQAVAEGTRKRRKLSAAARKAISDAQKKRWAALKKEK